MNIQLTAAPATAEFAPLNLRDPSALFDAPEVDGTVIRMALCAAIHKVPPEPDQPPGFLRLRLLAEAGRILLADPSHLAEAIHLTRAAAPDLADTAPLAHIRLIAMFRGGDHAGTATEADRVLQSGSLAPSGRKIIWDTLFRWNLERSLPPRTEYLPYYWPDVDAAIADPFGKVYPAPNGLVDRIGPAIARLNDRAPDDEVFLNRIRWGSEVQRRTEDIQRVSGIARGKPTALRTALEGKLLELQQAINATVTGIDLGLMAEHIDAGRSVLIAQAHAGHLHSGALRLPSPFPYSLVANVVGPATRPQDFNLSPLSPNATMGFAKLAKLMRKSPRVVRIFPDGAAGEGMTISVLGHPVRIGRGAATLAYLGKAATYFVTSHWTGSGFSFSLQVGPLGSDYADLETFEQAFGEFYARCLERIVLGPPEDIAPVPNRFWTSLKA